MSLSKFAFCSGPYNGVSEVGWWGGNAGGFTVGSILPAIDQTITRHGDGDACYRFNYAAGQTGVFGWFLQSNDDDYLVVRVYFRFDTLPTSGVCDIASLDSTGGSLFDNERAWVRYNAGTGRLEALIAEPGFPTAGPVQGPSISASTWYRLDMRVHSDGVNDFVTFDWSVDGSPQTQVTLSAPGGIAGKPIGFEFGAELNNAVSAATDLRLQDILVSLDPATYPLPPGRTKVLRPNGAGTHVNPNHFQDDDGSAIDANSYLKLRDDASGTETDWLAQNTLSTTSYLEFTVDDLTGESVLGVQVQIGNNHPGVTGASSIAYEVVDSAGNLQRQRYNGWDPAGFFTRATSSSSSSTSAIQPDSSLLYPEDTLDWGDVAGLRIRIGFSGDVSPLLRVHLALLEVAVEELTYWEEMGFGERW